MKISERRGLLLKALHAIVKTDVFTVAQLCKRIAGLATKDPGNLELLTTLHGCLGRELNSKRVGLLLKAVTGQRYGDLTLLTETHDRHGGRWRYHILDHANPVPMPPPPKAPRFNSLEKLLAHEEQQAKEREKTEREERREQDRATVANDPAANEIYKKLTGHYIARVDSDGTIHRTPATGRDGAPLQQPPPVVAPAAAPVVEKPTKKGWYPGCGRQPTRAELAARHHQHEGDDRIVDRGLDWFVRACAARNRG